MSNVPSTVNTENPHRREGFSLPGQQPPAESLEVTQERLLLYLKCLNIPPGKERLTLALEAIERLGSKGGNHDRTPAAVQSLRNLLTTSGLPIVSTDGSTLYSMGSFQQGLEALQSMPRLSRGHMLPVKFDQLPEWLSTDSFLTTIITQLRPLLIPLLILFNILLLIGLFFWL
jgi:hypothetical protein